MLQLASVTSTKPPKYQSSQLPLWCQVESQWNTLLHFTNKSHSERRRSAFLCPPEAHKLSLVASMALCHLNLLVLGGYSSYLIIIISPSNDFSTQQRWLIKSKSKVSFQFFFGNSSLSHSFHSKCFRFWIEQWLQMVPQQDAPCFVLLIQSVTKPCKTAMVLQAARRNWFKLNAASFKLPLVLVNHSNHIRWFIYFKKFSFLMTNTSDKSHHLNVDPQPFLASTQAKCPKTISQASTIVSVSSRKNPCQHAYDLNTLVITKTSSSCKGNLCACWFNQTHPNPSNPFNLRIFVWCGWHMTESCANLFLWGSFQMGVESLGSFPQPRHNILQWRAPTNALASPSDDKSMDPLAVSWFWLLTKKNINISRFNESSWNCQISKNMFWYTDSVV